MTGIPNPDTEAASLRELLASEKARADAAEANIGVYKETLADAFLQVRLLKDRLEEREATISTLTEQLAEARGALKPFAEAVENADRRAAQMWFAPSFDEYVRQWSFSYGDLRRALSALTTSPASSAPFDMQRVDDAIYSAIGLIKALTSDDVGDCAREELSYALQAVRSALTPASSAVEGEAVKRKFQLNDEVYKPKGSFWRGIVVGFYSTKQTPVGYCVQLEGMDNGPVQIYPEAALESWPPK